MGFSATAQSKREVYAVFAASGMDLTEVTQVLTQVRSERDDSSEFRACSVNDSLDDNEPVYERSCTMCQHSFKVTEAMQADCGPDSPFNICPRCISQLVAQDEDESVAQLSKHFQDAGVL